MVAVAEAAADVAGAVIRPFFRSGVTAALKADQSPVTIADRSAEAAIRAMLRERFPADGILGEEFGHERETAQRCWVLDPIDGTRAFLTGRPVFGTLIGLIEDGRPILGIIDQPITGERWVGAAGRETRFRGPFGGQPGCRPCARLDAAELSCTSPDMFDATELTRFRRLAGAVRRVSWGGDCYGYGLLALGQIDLIAEADLKPWDWAPLAPIVEGAGGRLVGWDGTALHLGCDGRVLAAGDPALVADAVRLLAP